ncbi:MAG: FecR domain-containing protein [Acidobacteria bacterium]|nr:FecR domain-containing protein [Acidobacteriota bacterium]
MHGALKGGLSAWLLAAAAAVSLCPAQPLPAGGDPAARAIQVTGQVSVLRDSYPWALKTGDAIQTRQVVITGADGFAIFQVSDGSRFEVYPNSRATFRNNPGNLRDLVDLWIGRVKVHIEKLGGQPNPNNVRTPTAVIAVRGTIFDVVVEDAEETTLVSVEEGLVAVQHALLPRGDPKLVGAGEYIRVYKNSPLARKGFDKGSALQTALRALSDAFGSLIYRSPGGGGRIPIPGSAGGGPTLPGDTQTTPPPPPPPPGDGGIAPPPPPPGN